MSTPPPMDRDGEHDAWLREALRHAPDADVAPPPALSALILRQAQLRARVAASARRAPRPLATRVWIWLAQPMVGAGLASVMIASVVGVMWWDRKLPQDAAQVADVAPAADMGEVASAPAQAPALAVPTPPVAAAAKTERAAPVRPAQRPIQPMEDDKRSRTAEAAAPSDRMAAAAPAPAPALAPPLPSPRVAGTLARSDKPASLQEPSVAPQRLSASRDARSGFAAMRSALAQDPSHWSQQRDGAAPQPVDERLAGWLAELDAAGGTRWTRSAAQPAPADSAALRLLRDGRVVHTLQLDEHGVQWQQALPDGEVQSWRAPLDEAPLRALRAGLARSGG